MNDSRRAAVVDPTGDEALVARPQLVRRLIGSRGTPLAMIIAPAGYGKSALLTEWSAHDDRSFAWLPLEAAHNDPLTLIGGIAAGLDALGVVSEGLPAAVAAAGGVGEARLLLRATVADASGPFVLVLDDADALSEGAAVDVLAMLIGHLRSGCQLAIASRTELNLPLGRLRGHRMLTEMRASDLVMTRRDAAQLARLCGVALDADGLELLVQRTEGWPVALYLATLAVRDRADASSALEQFAGDDRTVADYLEQELLSELCRPDIDFLTRTSFLDRLSGPLCDFVLEREDSARRLIALSRKNLLVVPLDRTDREYRYHRLLAQMLQAELHRGDPEHERVIHARASIWHEQHGDSDRAINHAINSADDLRAGRLLWRHAAEYLGYGRVEKLRAWLGRFRDDQIAAHPTLALSAGASALVIGDRNVAESWISAAARGLADVDPTDREQLAPAALLLRAAVTCEDLATMAAEATAASEAFPQDGPWLALACLLQGVAAHLTGDLDQARARLEEGARRGAASLPAVQVMCLAQLALLAIDGDDWSAAELYAARARAQVERTGLVDYATSALTYAVSADVQARIGRVEVSQDDAREARRLLSSVSDLTAWYETECAIALTRAALRLADVPGAHRLLAATTRHVQLIPEAVTAQRWFEACSAQADMAAEANARGGWSLTTAELRVLQYLPTHLSFPEIADRLYVSANTVKTHTRAVYRKLDATSRGEAVARAREAGLLDQAAHAPANM